MKTSKMHWATCDTTASSPCPACGATGCYVHCRENAAGGYTHEPDKDTVWMQGSAETLTDSDEIAILVNCRHCGQTGVLGDVDYDNLWWG